MCLNNSKFKSDLPLKEQHDTGSDLMLLVWISTHTCACLFGIAFCGIWDYCRSRQRQYVPVASLEMENIEDDREQRNASGDI